MPPKAIFFDVGGTLVFPDLPLMMEPLLRLGIEPSAEQLFVADKAAKHIHTRESDDSPGNRSHWSIYFSTLLEEIKKERRGQSREDGRLGAEVFEELVARASDSSYWTVLAPGVKETLEALRDDLRLA